MASKEKYTPEAYARRLKKAREKQRDYPWHDKYIAKTYKVTKVQYDQMLADQNGVCAICGGLPIRAFYCIDHSHKSGRIRGLLCHKCNSGIGMFQESLTNLKRAVEYVERHGE